MTFRVGQKIVCVDASGDAAVIMKVGDIFTVLGPGISAGCIEIDCKPMNDAPGNRGWLASRFRPIVDSKSTISFTEGAPKDSERWDNRIKQPVGEKSC